VAAATLSAIASVLQSDLVRRSPASSPVTAAHLSLADVAHMTASDVLPAVPLPDSTGDAVAAAVGEFEREAAGLRGVPVPFASVPETGSPAVLESPVAPVAAADLMSPPTAAASLTPVGDLPGGRSAHIRERQEVLRARAKSLIASPSELPAVLPAARDEHTAAPATPEGTGEAAHKQLTSERAREMLRAGVLRRQLHCVFCAHICLAPGHTFEVFADKWAPATPALVQLTSDYSTVECHTSDGVVLTMPVSSLQAVRFGTVTPLLRASVREPSDHFSANVGLTAVQAKAGGARAAQPERCFALIASDMQQCVSTRRVARRRADLAQVDRTAERCHQRMLFVEEGVRVVGGGGVLW
jgi:hypothetical protein